VGGVAVADVGGEAYRKDLRVTALLVWGVGQALLVQVTSLPTALSLLQYEIPAY